MTINCSNLYFHGDLNILIAKHFGVVLNARTLKKERQIFVFFAR